MEVAPAQTSLMPEGGPLKTPTSLLAGYLRFLIRRAIQKLPKKCSSYESKLCVTYTLDG